MSQIAALGPMNMYVKSLAQSELKKKNQRKHHLMKRKQKNGLAVYVKPLFAPVHGDLRRKIYVLCRKTDADGNRSCRKSDTRSKLFLYQKHIYCGNSESEQLKVFKQLTPACCVGLTANMAARPITMYLFTKSLQRIDRIFLTGNT